MDSRSRLASLLLVACAGCGGAGTHEKLVGTWTLDAQATTELPEFKRRPEEERAALFKTLTSMTLEIRFTKGTLQRTGTVKATGAQTEESDSYKVVKRDGTKMVLAVTTSEGDRKRVVVDLQGDRLILTMDDMRSVFVRK